MNNQQHLKEEILRMSGVHPEKCMRCGKCSGTCPAYSEMEYHPHQFVYMVEKGDVEKLANEDIINNFKKLNTLNIPIYARTPVIPEIDQEIDKISDFLKKHLM